MGIIGGFHKPLFYGNIDIERGLFMMKHNTHRLALMGLLTALGLIIGYIEFLIPIPLGIPGVKPGFANICLLYTSDAADEL